MRLFWVLVGLSLALLMGAAPTTGPAPTQESHAILAYEYQKSHKEDAQYLRFLSYYNYAAAGVVEKRVKSMRFWVNQLHLLTALSFAKPVPGSGGLLSVIDLRDFGWSSAAFSAVARREPYFREPAVDSATAILLREAVGIDQDPKTLHVEAVVRADWFFRETMESDRSPSYYDLLFSNQRFVTSTQTVRETFTGQDGVLYYRDVVKKAAKFVDFPKDEADYERIFAVDKFREHLKEFKIDLRHGAVVEGMEKGVSIVARQNRLVERILTSVGAYYKTFDVKETSGRRDFAETLNVNFEFDAGEILVDLPGGGMGALLVNAKGARLETADNRFATDNSDLKFDARVRTPGSCFICHEQKFIAPKNLVEEMVKAGIDIKFRKKADSISARGFFLDWQDKLLAEQAAFTKHIARTSGFKPGENASLLKAWRDEYDAPVTLAVAARESGVSQETFKFVAAVSTKSRILMLVKGLSIPRRTWEVDGYREFQLLLDVSKK